MRGFVGSALQVYAGPRARAQLRERGLRPEDVRVIPGAAGGPKGLILNALDRFVFGHWLRDATHTLHLPGASIGAWRLACACRPDPDSALADLADDYIHERYQRAPGKAPKPADISASFRGALLHRFGGHEHEVLAHPHRRVHVFTSRGRRLLARDGRVRTPMGYLGAFASNVVSRRAMGSLLERVIFSDPRDPLPVPTHDYRTRHATLTPENLREAILATCTIPFWLEAVTEIPGGPRGPYWDGGITDYHLHLDYAAMAGGGLVLYPHFQRTLVPGWLDKALRHRHHATQRLSNVVLLVPSPEWIATLPGGKLPDRSDFKAFGEDVDARMRAWEISTAEARRLADEFATLVASDSIEALPLP